MIVKVTNIGGNMIKAFIFLLILSTFTFAQSSKDIADDIEKEIEKILNLEQESSKKEKLQKALNIIKRIAAENGESSLRRQIALCNYLVEQACILEALDGRGVGVVRKELVQNINDHGLSVENKRHLRRLVELCEEAERSYSNVSYVEVDGSDAKADLLVSNIGAGVGISLALGDVTPLISSAVRIGRGYNNINKEKSRQLNTLIQSHKARITDFLFSVNSFKNDLIAEQGVMRNQIITPDAYRTFLKVLMIEDYVEKVKKLEELNGKFPGFKAVQYYLGEEYLNSKNYEKASKLFGSLIQNRNPIVHKDGFVGQSYTSLAKIYFAQKEYEKCISNSSQALKENNSNGIALSLRSESYLNLKKYEQAYLDAKAAELAYPEDPQMSWNVCKISTYVKPDTVSYHLKNAIGKGFKDFNTVRSWPGMKSFLKDWEIKFLLQPNLSASYKPGVFKDDLIIKNVGFSKLENFKYKIDLRYYKKEKWNSLILEGSKELFEIGEELIINNKFSMPKDSKCSIKVVFSSVQNPIDGEIIIYYNFNGAKLHLKDWEYELKKTWAEAIKLSSKESLQDLRKEVIGINEKSFYQNPDALSVLALLEYKLDNSKSAVDFQKKALEIMKANLPENLFKISAEPFLQALEKYSKGN